MVAKVIRYDQSGSFDEMLLASDANEGYNFTAMSDALRPLVTDELRINQLNRGDMDINSARAKLIDSINRGQKIVNYTGHGSVDQWSGDLLNPLRRAGPGELRPPVDLHNDDVSERLL